MVLYGDLWGSRPSPPLLCFVKAVSFSQSMLQFPHLEHEEDSSHTSLKGLFDNSAQSEDDV